MVLATTPPAVPRSRSLCSPRLTFYSGSISLSPPLFLRALHSIAVASLSLSSPLFLPALNSAAEPLSLSAFWSYLPPRVPFSDLSFSQSLSISFINYCTALSPRLPTLSLAPSSLFPPLSSGSSCHQRE